MLDPASLVLGLFGGAGGTLLVERYRHRNDLRHRGAAVVGPIFAMLGEADPDRLAINAGDHSREQLEDLWRRASEHDAALQALAIELSPRAARPPSIWRQRFTGASTAAAGSSPDFSTVLQTPAASISRRHEMKP
jgi:hypothetical protein